MKKVLALILIAVNLIAVIPVMAEVENVNLITDYVPEIYEEVSEEGFIHPGITVNAKQLKNMQYHARHGDEPWKSGFDALATDTRSAKNVRIYYNLSDSSYVNIPYGDAGLAVAKRAQSDSDTASKQALMYVITGDEAYRENCMNILRCWSRVEKSQVHTDQQIRWGIAFHKLCFAAEIMKYTSCENEELIWTDKDNEKFVNFLNVLEFTVSGWWYFMNQHSYAVKGYMAKAVFCNERDTYNICVERATVHSAYEPNNRGRNGSIKYQIACITEDLRTGEEIEPFIQVVEMGRDQPHAAGNIGALSEIAMTTYIQGTKVDRVEGTVTDSEDGVNLFNFLDDRLVKGANYMAGYNLGYVTEYYPCYFWNFDSWNRYHKGRVDPVFGILYNYYKYIEKWDMESNDIKYLRQIYETASSPEYSMEEFIGYSTLLFSPDEAAEDYVLSRDFYYESEPNIYEAENFTALRYGEAKVTEENGVRFVQTRSGSEFADRTFGHPFMGYSSIRVRTNGDAEIIVSRYDTNTVAGTFVVPNTNMKWVNVCCDLTGASGDSTMIFYTIKGEADRVDIDYLDLLPKRQAPEPLEIKKLENALLLTNSFGEETLYLLKGEKAVFTFDKKNNTSFKAFSNGKIETKGYSFTYSPQNLTSDKIRLEFSEEGFISLKTIDVKIFESEEELLDSLLIGTVDEENQKIIDEIYADALKSNFYENAKILADKVKTMPALVYSCNFEQDGITLYGNAKVEYDEEKKSNVLKLDGSLGTYAALPEGLMDGMDNITVSMDVLIHEEINGNYFTFTFGQDEKKYFFLKLDGGGGKIAVTKGSYSNESVAYGSGDFVGKWINVKIDITPSTIKFYADGVLIGENNNVNTTVTEIGKNLSCYLGKSYYESDLYCKAYYDNIKIYYNGLEAAK